MKIHPSVVGAALGLASILAAAAATPAAAQEWDGFYFGGHALYGMAHREGCTSSSFGFVPSDCEEGFGPYPIMTDYHGPGGGVQAGVNWQNGNTVWGLEGTLSVVDIAASDPNVDQWGGTNGIKGLATATARVGLAQDGWMIYAEGGLGAAAFHYGPNSANCEYDSVLVGGAGGVGIEAYLTDTVTGFIEVNGFHFMPSEATCTKPPATINSYSNTQTNAVVVRIGANVQVD